MSPHARKQGQATPEPDGLKPEHGKAEDRTDAAELSRAESEEARDQAERARTLAEEGRELSEEIRRGAESLRREHTGTDNTTEYGRQILEASVRAENWFKHRFDVLLDGLKEMSSELERLRKETAELRRMLSDMQQAAHEERIIAAERQATERQMDREALRDRR
jgi:hypothetical protein